mmetsp:Transcript_38932/g.71922  ORF Transcript_38932/g.71922 Transcript_38932/m.71922 type:complete len:119 (-) Transcript_38932:124-480(-)
MMKWIRHGSTLILPWFRKSSDDRALIVSLLFCKWRSSAARPRGHLAELVVEDISCHLQNCALFLLETLQESMWKKRVNFTEFSVSKLVRIRVAENSSRKCYDGLKHHNDTVRLKCSCE